ncbi:hypothetical protein C9374_012661 [Naegleria lovaniensis]|uniref:Carboxylic ester hydrolase n=1 Tax=Naegleria lovaniensis TaxID=51637 RepID=A0AA88KR64_NAELO|nr:uncharacterized protein C9374_012661 [Naegleria lovaniensis]KAG2392409.1 hypothetical protein C9374_012661 [Naegleria lovaniensis]
MNHQQRLASLIDQLKRAARNHHHEPPSTSFSPSSSNAPFPSIDFIYNVTSLGVLKGKRSPTLNFRSFKNVPYAQAPVGSLRWNDPIPVSTPFQGVLDSTEFGPQCPQNCLLPKGLCAETMSEDCLSLNVYTPDQMDNSNGSLPVMVFFPGGHFDMGTANCQLYDGGYFVGKTNVILVTVNYRLGAFGYLVDSKNGIRGNFALKDQRLALKWVQKFISAFGGNPNSVTIFGESAGAGSVTALLMNKESWPLFHKAILQSNPLSLPFRDISSSDLLGNRFITESGCYKSENTLQCIRNMKWQDVVSIGDSASNHLNIWHPIISFMPWTPCLDGKELFEQPLDAFKNGNYAKVPMIMGTLSEEAIMFVYLALSNPLPFYEYDGALIALFGLFHYSKVHSLYPPSGSDQRVEFSILGTDYIFTAPTRNALMNIHNHQPNIPVYLFEFNHTLSFSTEAWMPRYPFCIGHVCHGSELPILFHTSELLNLPLTPQEEELSAAMMNYWTNFAKTSNPNLSSTKSSTLNVPTYWERFTPSNLLNMELQTPNVFMNYGLRKQKLDMFDSIGYHHGY